MIASLFALLPLLALTSASPITKRESSRLIESGRKNGYCLSVQGGRAAVSAGSVSNGTPVTDLLCSAASFWDISRGSGSVIVSGTNYALDIGLQPGNNGALKVWQSYPGATQQTWYLTDDNRIAQTGGNQCIDQGDNGPQTYACTTGNTNQVYNVRFNDPATPSASASAVASSSAAPAPSQSSSTDILPNVPRTSVIPDVAGQGKRIHPVGRNDICLTVAGGFAGISARVGVAGCFNDYNADFQLWDLPSAGSSGPVRLHNHPELCLDAGSNPANGVGAKIYTCYDGVPQQTWYNSGTTLQTANNQCLDVVKESGPSFEKPYVTAADVQTWVCSTNGDPYQAFTVLA